MSHAFTYLSRQRPTSVHRETRQLAERAVERKSSVLVSGPARDNPMARL